MLAFYLSAKEQICWNFSFLYKASLHFFLTQLNFSLGYLFYFMLWQGCPHELVRFRKSLCLGITCYLFYSPRKWPEMTHFLLKHLVLSPQTWLDTSRLPIKNIIFFFFPNTVRNCHKVSIKKSRPLATNMVGYVFVWWQTLHCCCLKHSGKFSQGLVKNTRFCRSIRW